RESAGTAAPATRPPRALAARGHDARRCPRPRRRGDPLAATPDPHVLEGPRLHAASGAAIYRPRSRLDRGTPRDDPRNPREPHGGERHHVRRAVRDLERPPPRPADRPDSNAAGRGRRRGRTRGRTRTRDAWTGTRTG